MLNEENKSGEQKAAEADVESFRKDLGPFVVAAETTRMAMVFTDAKASDNPVIFANDSFLSLTGYDREEVLGQSLNFLMARGALPEALARAAPIAIRKSVTAARMAACSGPPSSSARFRMRAEMLSSISPRSWMLPSISRRKTASDFSWTS
jgi:hypothetical protein